MGGRRAVRAAGPVDVEDAVAPPGRRPTPGGSAAVPASSAGPQCGPLQPGDLLAERYRLVEPVAGADTAVLWRAVDEVLARAVAVKVLPVVGEAGRAGAQPFLDAAVRAGALAHPGLVRVYDAAVEQPPGRAGEVAYVISEWVESVALPGLLADGPLRPGDATDLLRQAADALTAAHARGVAHGRVHPGNLLVTTNGRLRVTDAAVGAAVHGLDLQPGVTGEEIRADTRDLAAVLYALLTGHWPSAATPQPAAGLPAAPAGGAGAGRAYSPRQVRAGVPRALDLVVSRGLDPARHPGLPVLATPAALADAAERAAEQAREAQRKQDRPGPPARFRRALPWLVAGSVVAAAGTGGWLFGLAVGDLPRRNGAVETIVSTTSSPPSPGASPAALAVDLTRATVRDFDPPPGDGQESPDKVGNAVDGDPSTAWVTSRYTTSLFGGLKQGVGLLVDLGTARALSKVEITLTAPGAGLELRVADTPGGTADAFRVVARTTDAGRLTTLVPAAGERGRYWLVWLTALPRDGVGYREGIAELRFS